MRLNTRSMVLAACVVLLAFGDAKPGSATDLRVSGAATVAGGIITPNKAAIEQETGLTLVMAVNGDANGLKDLYAGRCDIAMVAAPMTDIRTSMAGEMVWLEKAFSRMLEYCTKPPTIDEQVAT